MAQNNRNSSLVVCRCTCYHDFCRTRGKTRLWNMLLKRNSPVRSSEEVTRGLPLLCNLLFNSYKQNLSPLVENTCCSLGERMCVCTCRSLGFHAQRWIGCVQLMVHIWILTSIILNLDVIRFSLVCCSRYRCVYFHTPVLVLLSGDPAGGNVSGHQIVTLWITVNRLNISSRCHVFRRPCRWPFVIGPSVLKSQQSITANRDRNRLFNQIISHALRVCLSALKCSPHQTPAAERASTNAITAVAIVRGNLHTGAVVRARWRSNCFPLVLNALVASGIR